MGGVLDVVVCVDFMQKVAAATARRGRGEHANGSIGSNSEKIYGVYKTEKNGSYCAIATAKHQTRIFQRRKMRSQPKMDGEMREWKKNNVKATATTTAVA